jgi:hypothetical protein
MIITPVITDKTNGANKPIVQKKWWSIFLLKLSFISSIRLFVSSIRLFMSSILLSKAFVFTLISVRTRSSSATNRLSRSSK